MKGFTKLSFATATLAACAAANAATTFRITIENLGPQPLSPVFISSGNGSFDIFTNGTAASGEIEAIAEMGNVNPMLALAGTQQGLGNVLDFTAIHAGSPITPGNSGSAFLTADMDHRWFSFASMLGLTNDGFIGSAVGPNDGQIDLFNNGHAISASFTISFLNAWDAGTEANTEDAADLAAFGGMGSPDDPLGVITGPHTGIRGDNDLSSDFNWYGHDIARINIEAVPEPITMFALAPALLLLRRRRRA